MTPQELGHAITHPPSTGVFVSLTIAPGAERSQVLAHMRSEMVATAELYLAGHIAQWWSLADQPGALFLFRCGTIEEAKTLTDQLPLIREGLAVVTLTRIGPLMPILTLM
jgi:hypothetical protein